MTTVRFNNRPTRSFNNLMDDLLTGFPSFLRDDSFGSVKASVPVNVKEFENSYVLDVVAPGLSKESFQINLEKGLLTISFQHENKASEPIEKHLRKEYELKSFKRSFTLDEKVDGENISAQYVNGVLSLNLPKKAEVKPETKQISVQ